MFLQIYCVFVLYDNEGKIEWEGGFLVERYYELKKGEIGVIVSIGVYVVLLVVKFVIGYLFYLEVFQVDGLNNMIDIVVFVVVFIGLCIFQKFFDEDYFYGYFWVEIVVLFIVFIIMMFVGM